MNRPRIIQPGQSYTFSKYFELPFSPEDILVELGCSYERDRLQLPKTESKVISSTRRIIRISKDFGWYIEQLKVDDGYNIMVSVQHSPPYKYFFSLRLCVRNSKFTPQHASFYLTTH
ncbi:hypothetical protein [Anabaena azotica]|uniref:Uncharacterized protein n=1 Tax=Anabaena azotica FACHB-119 TaxID=947527 RepID=A0ABR8D501_9NOST|nr:hypothetical protein [Anabaena azotica]MBD2501551.1 hypothetical protein [Anabaena azotica FACHB-119]